MRMVLTSLILIAGMGTALAQPPALNAAYEFIDPVFGQSVLCDTADQIKNIATAPDPNEVFKAYRGLLNTKSEPTCIAGEFTLTVVGVTPIGLMTFRGYTFDAWDVEVQNNGISAHVLYIEKSVIS